MITLEKAFAIEARRAELVNMFMAENNHDAFNALKAAVTTLQSLDVSEVTPTPDAYVSLILADKHGKYDAALDAVCFKLAVLEVKKQEGGENEID